ncbi:MAG TPA: MFS transporter [Blastocatellia bacterium]|nr:MFS transporter [Blastocatellia bacterium]
MTTRTKASFALWVLFGINLMNFFDRQILGAVGETVRNEWHLSDTALGTLGTIFTVVYAAIGLPLGRLTDRITRTWILSAGVFIWSLFTAVSGLAKTYGQLFAFRLGVGIGEASCAPAATSLIGDLFPAAKRGKAMSVFMLGLPLGVAASFAVSSWVTQRWGWRPSFYVAAIPGLICAGLALLIKEPRRGAAETHAISSAKRAGSPFLLVLSIPTMWWIILSGALHNFNMYALGTFLSPFLQRVYHAQPFEAGLISMITYGLSGVPGLILGGIIGDTITRRRANGRLLVGAISVLLGTPLVYFALIQAPGATVSFTVLLFIGWALMYVYYATVYSTIQDVIEPSLRGTAMALYFFAMYVLGASLGPVGMGYLSSHFTVKAAQAAGVTETTFEALRPFAPEGLHSALFIIPLLGLLLAIVLFAGSRTVTKDMDRLQRWMREAADTTPQAEAAKAEAAK